MLGGDSVDTPDDHGHIGDIIRFEPYTLFNRMLMDRMLIAIWAEKAGLVEHGLAKLEPRIEQSTCPALLPGV